MFFSNEVPKTVQEEFLYIRHSDTLWQGEIEGKNLKLKILFIVFFNDLV